MTQSYLLKPLRVCMLCLCGTLDCGSLNFIVLYLMFKLLLKKKIN